jgi:hypothetical protein
MVSPRKVGAARGSHSLILYSLLGPDNTHIHTVRKSRDRAKKIRNGAGIYRMELEVLE